MLADKDTLRSTIEKVLTGLSTHLPRGAAPVAGIVQRTFQNQKLFTKDAELEFDLRTGFSGGAARKTAKYQPEWLNAAIEALSHKSSNLQFWIGAEFPYDDRCKATGRPELLNHIREAWLACKPLLDLAKGEKAKFAKA